MWRTSDPKSDHNLHLRRFADATATGCRRVADGAPVRHLGCEAASSAARTTACRPVQPRGPAGPGCPGTGRQGRRPVGSRPGAAARPAVGRTSGSPTGWRSGSRTNAAPVGAGRRHASPGGCGTRALAEPGRGRPCDPPCRGTPRPRRGSARGRTPSISGTASRIRCVGVTTTSLGTKRPRVVVRHPVPRKVDRLPPRARSCCMVSGPTAEDRSRSKRDTMPGSLSLTSSAPLVIHRPVLRGMHLMVTLRALGSASTCISRAGVSGSRSRPSWPEPWGSRSTPGRRVPDRRGWRPGRHPSSPRGSATRAPVPTPG